MMVAAPAAAQEGSPFSLVVSFPSPTVSVQWQLSERFALRFEGSYDYFSELSEEPASSSTMQHVYADGTVASVTFSSGGYRVDASSHMSSVGIAGIVTLRRTDQLHLYVAPQISLIMERHEMQVDDVGQNGSFFDWPDSETVSISSRSPSAGASFGAAVNIRPRLALFGEAGVLYFRTNTPSQEMMATSPGGVAGFDINYVTTRALGGIMIRF